MSKGEITEILIRMQGDRPGALNDLFPIVYQEMRALARRQLARVGRNRTLDSTGLVHEAYLKLVDQTRAGFQDRKHFFAVASLAMRHLVVDHARQRAAKKRGGEDRRVELRESQVPFDDRADEILAIDEAMKRLAKLNERLSRVVELRFFGGLSVEETAEILGVTDRTVKRDWRKARAFLHRELTGTDRLEDLSDDRRPAADDDS